MKDLDVMLGSASAALVMDDTLGVWPPALQPNLLHVPRYAPPAFFGESHRFLDCVPGQLRACIASHVKSIYINISMYATQS